MTNVSTALATECLRRIHLVLALCDEADQGHGAGIYGTELDAKAVRQILSNQPPFAEMCNYLFPVAGRTGRCVRRADHTGVGIYCTTNSNTAELRDAADAYQRRNVDAKRWLSCSGGCGLVEGPFQSATAFTCGACCARLVSPSQTSTEVDDLPDPPLSTPTAQSAPTTDGAT